MGYKISDPCVFAVYYGDIYEGTKGIGWANAKVYCPGGWSVGESEAPHGLPGFCYRPLKNNGPKNPGPPTTCGGTNPINLGSGNKYQRETDYAASSAAGLSMHRHYNSIGNFPYVAVGDNWRLEYDRKIEVDSAGYMLAHRHDGRIFMFKPESNGWAADPDINDRPQELKDVNGIRTGWRYAAATGEIERYDANGRLESITDTSGNTRTLTYDDTSMPADADTNTGLLAEVTDSFGRSLRFSYDDSRRVGTLTNPEGGVTTYSYDAQGNLVGVRHPDDTLLRYHYENAILSTALTGITDENGNRYARWEYDTVLYSGEAISSEHGAGVDKRTIVSENKGNGSFSVTVTDPLGSKRVYGFTWIHGVSKNTSLSQPAGSGCGPASAATSYDGNGNVARRTDFNGVVTTYTHDLARNLETQRIEAAGTPEARTVSTRWHPDWRLATRIAEPKKITTHLYNGQPDPDNADAIVTCAPADALVIDKPIAVLCQTTEQATTDPDGSQGFAAPASGAPRIWRFTYNRYGQPLAIDGPRTDIADITTHDYWPIDAACPGAELGTGRDKGCRGQLRQSTDPLGHITRYTRYNAHGQLEESIDPNGLVTTQTWDLRQRLTRRTVGDESTAWTYDPAGQLKRLTQSDGNWIDHAYDDAHRLIRIADKAGNRIDYTLDPAGNRIGEDVLDPAGTLSTTLTRSYDALGRIQALSGARQP